MLLDEGFLGLREDGDQGALVEFFERGCNGHAADELGYETVLEQVLGLEAQPRLAQPFFALALDIGPESHGLLADALFDDRVQAHKSSAADEQDIRRINLDELLVGMLPAALRRGARRRPLHGPSPA